MRALVFFLAVSLFAQSAGDTLTIPGFTLTAAGGDGSVCVVNKIAGTVPSMTFTCTPGAAGGPGGTFSPSQKTATSGGATFSYGDITCIVGINATPSTVTIGSIGAVPPSGAVVACAVNLRATPAGPVTGNLAVSPQTFSWP